uniref:DNA (cytosine-5-)-methyltransferase n=1 Tax=Astyanax mexicanus TaxID=7994 RepID=A0A3B1IJJ3_ASTMX
MKGKPELKTLEALDSFSCSQATMGFISKHWPAFSASVDSPVSNSTAKLVLGRSYPSDITTSCIHDPYCLYLYNGVELLEGETGSVILIGYFDQIVGRRQVRLLDVIQPTEKTSATLFTCILETLKKFKIPAANLAVFYSNDPDPAELISSLQALNPATVFLCSLTDLPGRVCHSGIMTMELSEQIQDLLKNIHQHFTSLPASLKEQLSSMEDSNFTASLTSSCSLLRTVVYKVSILWPDLVQYFNSLDATDNVKEVCGLLNDQCLKLTFLFLSHALKPLCELQESWDRDEDLRKVLQDAFGLVQLYASSYLQPKAMEQFLGRRNVQPKGDWMKHLPREEVKLGVQVTEYLRQNTAKLTDPLDLFYKSAVSFYKAVSFSIVKSLPLSDSVLRTVALILSAEGKLKVTGKSVVDLGTVFGANDDNLLTDEFLEYQFAERENCTAQTVEQYWKAELRIMGTNSIFRKLILKLLALPVTLRMESIFAQVFKSVGDEVLPKREVSEEMMQDNDDGDEEDATDSSSYKSAPSHPLTPETPDVIDLRDDDEVMITNITTLSTARQARWEKKGKPHVSDPIIIDDETDEDQSDDDDDDDDDDSSDDEAENDSDETDDDVMWIDNPEPVRTLVEDITSTSVKEEMESLFQVGEGFAPGEMVWAQIDGLTMWPGLVQEWTTKKKGVCKIVRFGDSMVSKTQAESLRPYSAFSQCFCTNSFATVTTYKEAVFHSLQVAANRSGTVFSLDSDSDTELLCVLLDWAFGGFKPAGPNAFKPRAKYNAMASLENECRKSFSWSSKKAKAETRVRKTQRCWKSRYLFSLKEVSVCLENISKSVDLQNGWLDLRDKEVSKKLRWKEHSSHTARSVKLPLPDRRSAPKKQKYVPKYKDQNKDQNKNLYLREQKNKEYSRHEMVHKVLVEGRNIEDFCLSCGTGHVEVLHPLFEGSLCLNCKNNFTETLYRYDDDGYQSYCTVCCAGLEVILCGHHSCCRSFCLDCVDILVGKGTFNKLKDLDPWICYLCAPESSSGALKPRNDWSIRVQSFFANDSAMAFEPHRVYPSIPANLRRPIRVLSLFDGISTGYLVLRDLGFKVEKYVASEVDDESIAVSIVNHEGKITQVDDVRRITKQHIDEWGPFDLLIGGSPCNDLSIVNPARKGLFEGTGRLFFDYYRLLNMMKPKEDDPRPFFWLFENVVFMNTRDKLDICRFLECNPVLVDAVKVSPAHRARYFWGNIPGMNRPITASQKDKLTLQECLEPGRTAKYVKIRTITTRTNSLKQGANDRDFPITSNGKDDGIWITEMEKIFGFPKHYTDVKNMGRLQRQKVLGKSWSVPVIRHLFAPLKDYFACDEVLSKNGEL